MLIDAKISHQSVVFPKEKVVFAGEDMKRVVKGTGIESVRRVPFFEGEPYWDSLDLAFEAAWQVMNLSGMPGSAIKHLVFVTQTPRHQMPSNSPQIAAHIKAADALCTDVNQSCSGYVHGLYLLGKLLEKGETGMLVCADTVAKHCGDPGTKYLFSDAASATLMTAGCGSFALEFDFLTEPEGLVALNKPPVGNLHMDGAAVMKMAVSLVPPILKPILERHPYAQDVYLHQANANILGLIERRLPKRTYHRTVKEFGNASMVSVPLTMNMRRPAGHSVACGFGGGFCVAAAYLGNLADLSTITVEV